MANYKKGDLVRVIVPQTPRSLYGGADDKKILLPQGEVGTVIWSEGGVVKIEFLERNWTLFTEDVELVTEEPSSHQ